MTCSTSGGAVEAPQRKRTAVDTELVRQVADKISRAAGDPLAVAIEIGNILVQALRDADSSGMHTGYYNIRMFSALCRQETLVRAGITQRTLANYLGVARQRHQLTEEADRVLGLGQRITLLAAGPALLAEIADHICKEKARGAWVTTREVARMVRNAQPRPKPITSIEKELMAPMRHIAEFLTNRDGERVSTDGIVDDKFRSDAAAVARLLAEAAGCDACLAQGLTVQAVAPSGQPTKSRKDAIVQGSTAERLGTAGSAAGPSSPDGAPGPQAAQTSGLEGPEVHASLVDDSATPDQPPPAADSPPLANRSLTSFHPPPQQAQVKRLVLPKRQVTSRPIHEVLRNKNRSNESKSGE